MTTLQKIIKYCALAFAVFLCVSIIGGICGALGMLSVFFGGDGAGEMKNYAISSEVKNLDVDLGATAFEIVGGDRFMVESNHKSLSVKEENGTLSISEKKFLVNMSSKRVSVVLTVPENFVFEDVSISAGAGRVDVEMLSANTLNVDFGAGAAEIECLNVYTHARVDSGTGKLTVRDGDLHDLTMDIGMGELELTGKLSGKCTMDYGVGNAKLTLLGKKEDYQIELDKGVGNATLEGESMSDDSVYGAGSNQIDIDGGVGNIRIQFQEER